MQIPDHQLRPSEKVDSFLKEYLSLPQRVPGERLPNPKYIAKEIGVSESTVRGVIKEWLEKGILSSRKGSGIFIGKRINSERSLKIGVNMRQRRYSGSFGWGELIQLKVLETALELGPDVSISSLYSATEDIDSLQKEEIFSRCEKLDGIIIYQGDYRTPLIADYCKKQGKPILFINPPHDDTPSNFVTLGNFTSFYRITHALVEAGRKRFAVLVSPQVNNSVSVRQKVSGLVNGIGDLLGKKVELRILSCKSYFEPNGEKAISELIKEGYIPDAIFATGDNLILGALNALKKKKILVPEQCSVISASGHHELINHLEVTTMLHPIDGIGKSLVEMLVEMIRNQLLEVPPKILPIGFRVGKTTTEEENKILTEVFQEKVTPPKSYRST